MNRNEYEYQYKSKDFFKFGQHSCTLSSHLKRIINSETSKNCRGTKYWSNTVQLPKDWIDNIKEGTFYNIVSVPQNLNSIHLYKQYGISNTHWDFTEYLQNLETDLSKKFINLYGYEDPIERSLINFLDTHKNGIWEIISWNNEKCEKENRQEYLIDFTKGLDKTIDSLNHFQKILIKNAKIIFFQPEDKSNNTLFSNIIKQIIKTKTWGKVGVQLVQSDMNKRNIKYILTNSGDLLDIDWGIDMILLSPQKIIGKTTQIKKCKEIKVRDSKTLEIYCEGVKDYFVDFFSFCIDDKVRYFVNNKPPIENKRLYLIDVKDEIHDLVNEL